MEKKCNESKDLEQWKPVADALTEPYQGFPSPTLAKVRTLMTMGLPMWKAGQLSGYTESYSKSGLSEALKKSKKGRANDEEFSRMFPDLFRTIQRFQLTDLAEIQAKIIAALKEDPSKMSATEYKMLRDLAKMAGALQDDAPVGLHIDVNAVADFALSVFERGKDDTEVVMEKGPQGGYVTARLGESTPSESEDEGE